MRAHHTTLRPRAGHLGRVVAARVALEHDEHAGPDFRADRCMLAHLADENLDGNVVRRLLRRKKDLNIVRAQDVGLSGAKDTSLLEWAAHENRILLTHDV